MLTTVAPRMMNTLTPKPSKAPKAPRRHDVLRGRRCLRCPFCAPSGACLEKRMKSGRCGDWVFQVVRGKQFRHLWKKPRDPRTPSQLQWRGRLTAASRKYSHALTDEQMNACIAAGAKRRSRPRLGQSGPLTGQQWWVRSQCSGEAEGAVRSTLRSAATEDGNAQTAAKALQTKGVFTPTWDTRRSASLAPPGQHRRNTRRARPAGRKSEIRRPKPERRPNAGGPKAPKCPGARVSVVPAPTLWMSFGFRASDFGSRRSAPWRAVRMRPAGLGTPKRAAGTRAGWVEADLRHRRGAVQRERGPPEQMSFNADDGDRALVRPIRSQQARVGVETHARSEALFFPGQQHQVREHSVAEKLPPPCGCIRPTHGLLAGSSVPCRKPHFQFTDAQEELAPLPRSQ